MTENENERQKVVDYVQAMLGGGMIDVELDLGHIEDLGAAGILAVDSVTTRPLQQVVLLPQLEVRLPLFHGVLHNNGVQRPTKCRATAPADKTHECRARLKTTIF